MPARDVAAVLERMFAELRPGGAMYQFTYGYRAPVSDALLGRLGIEATRLSTVLANAPPASVYRLRRR